jgi:hypothetical protein
MLRMPEREERVVGVVIALVFFLLLGGSALRSPDGMEMLRLSASWLGRSTDVGDPSFWPPLWSFLNMPTVALGYDTAGARLLNLMCWGLLAWPLHSLASQLGGQRSGRISLILYLLVPAFLGHSPVLDARALGALISMSFIAAAVAALRRNSGLVWVLVFAALAPLARPEGVLFPVFAAAVVWMLGNSWWKAVLAGGAAFLPHAMIRSSVRGFSGHEQLFAPWYGTWSTWDLLSLFGPASVPTEFRRFALAAVETGVVTGDPAIEDAVGVLAAMPGGLAGATGILLGAIGFVGFGAVLKGFSTIESRRLRWSVAGLIGIPLLAVAVAPMAKDQAGPLSNYLFVLPALFAMAAVGLNSIHNSRLLVVALGIVIAETHLTPLHQDPPYFLEGSEAADLAAQMLVADPPESGIVGADFSSRDVVLRAGLTVRPLGPIWAGPVDADLKAVMINSVGAKGEDGGRTLRLLESREWRVEWVVGDGDIAIGNGEVPAVPRKDRGWYALLSRRP